MHTFLRAPRIERDGRQNSANNRTQILGLSLDKINPLGGAIALGHAIGSSGARILTTLVHNLKPGEFGCVAICNGGGAATAMVVQRIDSV